MPLTEVQIHDGVLGVGVPAAFGFVGALLGLWSGQRADRRDESSHWGRRLPVLGPALGLGLGYVFTILMIQGLPAGGGLLRSASHIQTLVVGMALVLAALDALRASHRRALVLRWGGRALIVAMVLVFQLKSAREYQWPAGLGSAMWTAGIGLWMLLTFAAFDVTFTRSTTTASLVPIGIFILFSIPAIFDAGATAQWQISLGLAAALFGVAGAGLLVHRRTLKAPLGTLMTVWVSGVVVLAYLYSEMPMWHAIIFASAPVTMALPDAFWPKLCRHRRLAIRSGLAVAMGVAMSYAALPGMAQNFFGA